VKENKDSWRLRKQWLIIGLFPLMLFFAAYYIYKPKDFNLQPSNTFRMYCFDDTQEKGNSIVYNCDSNSNCVLIKYKLQGAYIYPYIGFSLVAKDSNGFDLSMYNRIELETSASEVDKMNITLHVLDANVKNKKHRLAQRFVGIDFPVLTKKTSHFIQFKDLYTPDWWFDAIKQSSIDFDIPDFSNVKSISFNTSASTPLDKMEEFKLYKLKFYRDDTQIILLISSVYFALIFMLYYFFNIKIRKSVTSNVTISYKSVETANTKDSSFDFLEFINNNYQISSLTLAEVAENSTFTERKISELIQEMFQCYFKTYINQIRIEEAKRLMIETDNSISEIAFLVGFNSPTNFSRVFKNIVETSPTDYLNANRK
jgi:AraC-like DNA-binding protein